ncbi:putative monooxygenase [Triangularia setosa]|uniref:Monooxygenase n=1 Tax=Triangularia setosa TaxID=2587417 RepID=A0AAN7A3N9_9PEZI|nr:putative monooxygenase [Podospora setosa]
MSAPDNPFKIIIIGGGIAGLTLANMLEKFEIDYILLEAHDNIAPAVGASIGLFPNGLLILDQIGCYEPVRAVAQSGTVKYAHMRHPDGSSVSCIEDFFGHLERRHGYEMLFFDRQWLLQVLFDQLRHKDRVVLDSHVETIQQFGDSIRVRTKAGKTYTGSIAVGADGIHSTVRHEMRRLAHLSDDPESFPSEEEEDTVPCYYQCSFGIAKDVDNWPERNQCFTSGDGHCFLVASGPDNRVYWFMFKRLPKVKYGKDIPRYTKEDEEVFVQKYGHVPITEDLTFGKLFERRISSTLTPLHEVVFKKWFLGRIILMGDSIHKSNPIGGMGGNGAIETAAAFVNFLLRARNNRPNGLRGLTTVEIEAISRQTQNERYERAKYILKMGHEIQALFASEKPLLTKFAFGTVLPLSGLEHHLSQMGSRLLGGPKLDFLPVPPKPRAVPYDHELPAKPVRGWPLAVIKTLFSVGMGLSLAYPFQAPLLLNTRLQGIYTLSQIISPLLTYTIEGHRVGNQGTLLALPSLFVAGIEAPRVGMSKTAPIHGMVAAFQSFTVPPGRRVNIHIARALVPALSLGYVIPTLFAFRSKSTWKTGLMTGTPLLVPVLTTVLSAVFRWWQNKSNGHVDAESEDFQRYKKDDVPVLRTAYSFAVVSQAVVHAALVAHAYVCLKATPFELATLPFSLTGTVGVLGETAYSILNLRLLGYVTGWQAARVALLSAGGQVVLGPGATMAGVWWWREEVIAGFMKERT